MRRSVAVALALVGAAACSYVFELPSTNPIAPLPDAALEDAADAGDASITDAAPSFDAPPVVRFCDSQTSPSVYCSDLDEEPPPALASIGTTDAASGQLLLSNAVALSPPRSLLSSVSGDNAVGSLTRALGSDPEALRLSFDMLVSAWATVDARLSGVELATGDTRCVVRLDGSATTWALTQVCSVAGVETAKITTPTTSPIARARWQRFAIGVTLAPTRTVTLDIDGVRVVDVPAVDALVRGQASIALGTTLLANGTATIFQDNVLVTAP